MELLFLFCISCILALIDESIEQVTKPPNGDPLEEKYGRIRYAALIFRHGDRNPASHSYPLDPYKNNVWPQGYLQLTNKGKRRLFEVGQWFKRRYQNLINDSYNHEDVTMQSSDTDRSIMSGQCFLRGFYPAKGPQIWLENEQWQPIPVHTIPANYDNMISFRRECPRLLQLIGNAFADLKYQQIYRNYEEIIRYIEENTGLNFPNKTITESLVTQLFYLHDTFLVQSENNLTLPNWTKKVYPEPLETILELTEYNEDCGLEGKRLAAGPILNSIISDMVLKNDAKFTRKLHLYSAHEWIICKVMMGLNVRIREKPPYGSTLMFELRQNNIDDFVTISFKNTSAGPSYLLSIPGCKSVCTLEEFLKLTKPLIPQDWDRECRISSSFSYVTTPNFYLLLIVVGYFLL